MFFIKQITVVHIEGSILLLTVKMKPPNSKKSDFIYGDCLKQIKFYFYQSLKLVAGHNI